MDGDGSGIYVAPLKIKKRRDGEPSQQVEAITPDNSISIPDVQESPVVADAEPHTIFQSLLRAVYPFAAASTLSSSTISLSLGVGDLIFVHSVHTNGWADGTLLKNGERGWLPTNYCQMYDEPRILPLLRSLIDFWDLVRVSSSEDEFVWGADYMRGMIAGVRFLLERSDCLTRDSPLIKTYGDLRRCRKALLSELSLFVKTGKKLQVQPQGQPLEELLDELLLKAFLIISRSVAFLDIWNDNLEQAVAGDHDDRQDQSTAVSDEFSPVSRSNDGEPQSGLSTRARSDPSTASTVNVISPRANHFRTKSLAAYRLSYHESSTSTNLVSHQLITKHDNFLSVLGTFLGSHIQSRSSSELLLTTQHAVRSCREFVNVIEIVIDHHQSPSPALAEARNILCERMMDLVHAARDVFVPQQAEADEADLAFFSSQGGEKIVDAATACLRVAGECLAHARLILEAAGDFAWDSPETPASLQSSAPLNESSTANASILPTSIATYGLGISGHQPSENPLTPPLETLPSREKERTLPFPPGQDLPFAPSGDADIGDHESHLRHRSLARTVVISSGSNSTYVSSHKDSEISALSESSTRATSPDSLPNRLRSEKSQNSFVADNESADDLNETEAQLIQKTYAHELMFNKDGQVIGGTLPALIEKLTAHDSTPNAVFTSTFYLTFRLFVSPKTFAAALADRFKYVGDAPQVAGPVRLRVYNVFKCWMESHWRHDCDDVALTDIVDFATTQLCAKLPGPGARLLELAEKVSTASSPTVSRVVTAIGRTNTSFASYFSPDTPATPPMISRSQLVSLRTWKSGGPMVTILDFDPLELARQITLKVSALFCSILPEELLATEWQKRSGSLAVNVNALSKLSTDLTNLVSDSILQLEEPKKRAAMVKQWIKIAYKCFELNNIDTLMAIIAALKSSTLIRMKKTWEIVSQKTKTTLEGLEKTIDLSLNHATLRQRLQNQSPPCIPFLGMYLTDLTFVDHGNPMTRQLNTTDRSISLINFDKHMKTAKIISDLQRFQMPYRLTEVPELQIWMQDQLVRVRSLGETSLQNHYRRSLLLEPREQAGQRNSAIEGGSQKDRFDLLAWTHLLKEKPMIAQG